MSHARIQFDLDRDADGTFALSDYNISDDDKWMDAPEILTPIPNIHTFLADLYEKGEGR